MNNPITYCSHCGGPVNQEIPRGDNRLRDVCGNCRFIHYVNPKVVVGCLITHEDQILLCKRAIEPRSGLWTLPAGFMENQETTEAGALRESWEEACAELRDPVLFGIYNIPRISQIYILYHAQLSHPEAFAVGEETLDVQLFSFDAIPWDKLAFQVVEQGLQHFLAQKSQNQSRIEHHTIG